MPYNDKKIINLFDTISSEVSNFKGKLEEIPDYNLTQGLEQFQNFQDNREFTSISVNTKETFSFEDNGNVSTIKSSYSLPNSVLGSISRKAQSISTSQDQYNYGIGNSLSIKIGNSYSSTNLNDNETKFSESTGNSISMSLGNSKSKTVIDNNTTIKRGKSYSIKDFSGQQSSRSFTGKYYSSTSLINHYTKVSSLFACDTKFALFRFDISLMPLKGHFTAFQQIISGVYGDFIHFENLARVFATSFTALNYSDGIYGKKLDACSSNVQAYIKKSIVIHRNTELLQAENTRITNRRTIAKLRARTISLQNSYLQI